MRFANTHCGQANAAENSWLLERFHHDHAP
jgi:hypothetical protein